MNRDLERRVQDLELSNLAGEGGFKMIAIQIVSPGNLEPANNCCEIDGKTHWRAADETPKDFEGRMHAIADDLNRKSGKIVRLILSETDLAL